MIISLEEHSHTLRIFYQDILLKPQREEKKDLSSYGRSANIYGAYGQNRYRGAQDDRVQVNLDFNPYANIGSGNGAEVQER